MPQFDLPLDQLRTYRPEVYEPEDFDGFWTQTLDLARRTPVQVSAVGVDPPLATVDAFDVTFAGWAGEPIRGWLMVPRIGTPPFPCVVQYMGYNVGRGTVYDHLFYSALGYAHFVMDSRGQIGADTPDSPDVPRSPSWPGMYTVGVTSAPDYYYRRLVVDAVRAIDSVRSLEQVDADRIVLAGSSQGGGLGIAAAALVPDVAGVLSDLPFMCNVQRGTVVAAAGPYVEIASYLQRRPADMAAVFATLGYFDGVTFAERIRCPAHFSVGLMDTVCPPSTIFAAFNRLPGAKAIDVWPYNVHEQMVHQVRPRIDFVAEAVGVGTRPVRTPS